MPEFTLRNPGVQFLGAAIIPMIDGFGIFEDDGKAILAKHGLKDLKLDQWYPADAVMKAMTEVSAKFGNNVLYQIGRAVPRNAVLPPELNAVEKVLALLDVTYRMNTKGENSQGFKVEMVAPGHAKVVVDRAGSCHLDRGILTELVGKLAPRATVQHDDAAPCRRKPDGYSCTYHVKW